MQVLAILTLFLVASATSATSSQQESAVVNSVPVSEQSQNVPALVSSAASAPVGVEVPQPVSGVVVGEQQVPGQAIASHHVHHPSVASYYAPSGNPVMHMVSGEQVVGNVKPVQMVRNFEQYGQPESASLPANYKPFGSWGLYIGGNPADGYYSNYYKALGSSVAEKQQADQQSFVKPVVSQTAALAPILRQAGSSPYTGGEYYPFAYSPAELSNSAARVNSEPQVVHHAVATLAQSAPVSPVHAGAQVHGTPATFDSNYASVSSYADAYATKKVGAAGNFASKGVQMAEQKEVQLPPSKGYQSRVYVYPSPVSSMAPASASPVSPLVQMSAPLERSSAVAPANLQQSNQQQVVAYAVPVGSQIIGSQAGVEGSFAPYGVHAFTRYAVKPTIMNQDHSYYYSSLYSPFNNQAPAYKQSAYYMPVPQQQSFLQSYPFQSYYGYPVNQLQYAQVQAPVSPHQYQYQQAAPQFAPVFAPVAPQQPQQQQQLFAQAEPQYQFEAAPVAPVAPVAVAPEKYEAPELKSGVKTVSKA